VALIDNAYHGNYQEFMARVGDAFQSRKKKKSTSM
jgi:hypothetical protein